MKRQLIANKTLEYLIDNKLDINPMMFSIWYSYFLGENKNLISRIKSLRGSENGLTETSYHRLYESYILREHFRDSLGINEKTSQIIDRANELRERIHEFVENIQGHQAVIGDMSDSLSVAKTREAIQIILNEALSEMKTVEKESEKTTIWMKRNVQELDAVKKDVIDIEQNMNRDFLTGLPDRTYYEKELEAFLNNSMSGIISKKYFVVFDIEDLDHYNQQYSWLVGDSILRLVVKIIQTETEQNWEMMRLEEDELAVFTPNGFPVHKIPEYVERVRTLIEGKQVMLKNQQKSIKNITVNAAIIKVEVFDDLKTVQEKVKKGLKQIKDDPDLHVVQVDKL
ncbi:GGDEF domain-containing protein [Hydrogenovibrio sp. SC-1]|uniref:GGDEF domain-containing protein n=1 Tax=Hydrogenovibrio sp. SC-1 TaxID=2065820 RepID=UPI000C799377|nr:diguanylate cyclase [Hydrogenovibrio sp. SC-1]PLA75459.1 GGDEF domain-containing protein [Hydrogenovibrio sp. SC-1]